MKLSRIGILSLLVWSFAAIAVPSYALCVKCDSSATCWASTYATAARCESSGTSCLTSGTCSGGSGCTPEECGIDVDVAEATPLNLDYKVAEVKIERPSTTTARVAVAKTMSRAERH